MRRNATAMVPGHLPALLRHGVIAALTLLPAAAGAETVLRPTMTDQGVVQSQSERRDREERDQPASILPSSSVSDVQAAADQKPLFTLEGVDIDGARALSSSELEAAVSSLINRPVSQAGLTAITAAISERYRTAGFHLSRAIIPPQDMKRGRLRIQVIEGTIEEIVVDGDPDDSFGVRLLLAPIAIEQPSRRSTLERQLLLANDRPGVRISDTAVNEIVPASGRFRLTVSVQSWRAYSAIGVDNLGSVAVGPWQASASAALNSIVVAGDSLSITGSTVPNALREMRFGRISYDMPIGTDSFRIGASASHSEVWPGDERRSRRTRSRADTYEVRASYAPVLTQIQTFWITASAGISDVSEQNAFGRIYDDRIKLASLSADYKLHAAAGSWSYLNLTYRQGLGLVDAQIDSSDSLSRRGASGHFSLVNGSFTHYQTLIENWSLKLAAAGQIASGPLLSSQQYYFGGNWFGRGFGGGWISGDNAVAGSAELRFDQPLNFAFAKGYQLYSFIEGGLTETKLEPRNFIQRVASVGVGVRIFVNDDLQFGVGIARPISQRSPLDHDRGTTILFSLTNAMRLCPSSTSLACRS